MIGAVVNITGVKRVRGTAADADTALTQIAKLVQLT